MLHRPVAVPAGAPATASRLPTTPRFVLAVAAIWLAAVAIVCAVRWSSIAGRVFPDVDDELRLVEVRDWLGGQSFRDVSQHRMNQPFGAPMHWSRIVDAPLAACELALRPLLGADMAQVATAVIVPMLTLGVVMLLLALIARRLAGRGTALLAAAALPTALATMLQLQPLRVDHHGWEIACALAALAASLSERRRAAGMIAGAAIAVGLQISLELLPFAAALGAVIAARWLIDPSPVAARRLAGYAAALAVVEAALAAVLHARAEWGVAYCDAVSSPHLLALGIVAVGVPALVALAPRGIVARGGALALVASLAAIAFRAVPPHCGLDPFTALGPLEHRFWLANVLEGRPAWEAGPTLAIIVTGFPIVGLACAAWTCRRHAGLARTRWLAYAALLLAATVVGIACLRASALSNALALVPVADVALRLVRRLQADPRMPARVFGSAAVLILLSPWMPGLIALSLPLETLKPLPGTPKPTACTTPAAFRALDTLPPARILAPLDIGPALLLDTHHAVLASGHHRNHVAMRHEIAAMVGPPDVAERVVRHHGLQYVLMCPELNELAVYRRKAPRGFAAAMLAGHAPPWLARVRLPGAGVLLWRVQPPAGLPSSRSAGGAVPAASQIARSAGFSPSS